MYGSTRRIDGRRRRCMAAPAELKADEKIYGSTRILMAG
jgi:hypothetical protein